MQRLVQRRIAGGGQRDLIRLRIGPDTGLRHRSDQQHSHKDGPEAEPTHAASVTPIGPAGSLVGSHGCAIVHALS